MIVRCFDKEKEIANQTEIHYHIKRVDYTINTDYYKDMRENSCEHHNETISYLVEEVDIDNS